MSQSLERGLAILDLIAERPMALSAIAQALEVHRSTALRLLQSLEGRGYARRTQDSKWGLGFALIAAANRALDSIVLREVAHEHLLALSRQLGHTIHLAQLVDDEVVYVDKVEGAGALRMHSRIGTPVELHTSGVAKAILAYAGPAQRSRLISRCDFRRYTETTITSREEYAAELEQTRVRGWAIDDGEHEPYVNCVSLPIFDARGRVQAALSVTALKALADLDALEGELPVIREAVSQISVGVGGQLLDGNVHAEERR